MGCRAVEVDVERPVKEAITGNYLFGLARQGMTRKIVEIIFVVESIRFAIEFL